jgi:hypothetical protein
LRQDDPVFGEQAAAVVDQRGTLTDQPFADAMQRLEVLLVDALDRHKAHRWAGRRLENGFGGSGVVLRALEEGLYEPWVDQAHSTSSGLKLPRPVMRARAGFHRDYLRVETIDNLRQLGSADLARDNHPIGIYAVHVKRLLAEIDRQ